MEIKSEHQVWTSVIMARQQVDKLWTYWWDTVLVNQGYSSYLVAVQLHVCQTGFAASCSLSQSSIKDCELRTNFDRHCYVPIAPAVYHKVMGFHEHWAAGDCHVMWSQIALCKNSLKIKNDAFLSATSLQPHILVQSNSCLITHP